MIFKIHKNKPTLKKKLFYMKINLVETEKTDRLLSLDALRGFDMFWITGGATLFIHIGKLTGADWLAEQMDHVKWEGFHLLDLVFPLFMFLSGVSVPFAINSKLEKGAAKKLMLSLIHI
jgi:predicted acyltransferase